ncbi:hypothetical protein KJ611_03040 [Patescibacteria group bacterium]|nr:hypothetical protein [Patescibacteria group bacterium]MBU1705567.1 hypothetical protein [Patescibacteria group bacterium]
METKPAATQFENSDLLSAFFFIALSPLHIFAAASAISRLILIFGCLASALLFSAFGCAWPEAVCLGSLMTYLLLFLPVFYLSYVYPATTGRHD